MKLTQQQYEKMLTTFGADNSDEEGRPRRARVFASTRIWVLDNGNPSTTRDVAVRDLSSGGICIMQYEPLEYGREFVIELPMGDETARVICVARYCRQLNENLLAIGAEFISPFIGRLPDSDRAIEAA